MQHNVIVIGAGLAGMVAADAAQSEGADVLLVDKGGIGLGSNSAISNGVFTGPSETYDLDAYIKDTIDIGKRLNDASVVGRIGREASDAIKSLRRFGVDIKEYHGRYIAQPSRPDVIRGVSLVKKIADYVKGLDRVKITTGFYVTDIIVQENQVQGIRGFDASGKTISIPSPAVIMAAGGAGAIYLRNDNQKSTMGQGYALCAKAGLELWDMEFVQFFPMVFDEPRLPSIMIYPGFPKEAKLVNAAGEDIAQKHGLADLLDAIQQKRDAFSQIVYAESLSGPVHMDFRDVLEDSWQLYPLSLLGKIKFDFKNTPVRISAGAHYLMGGVRIDAQGQTGIRGLFACGELVWGLHGANRRGGNALTECAVFGRIAGQNAAICAKEKGSASIHSHMETASQASSKSEDLRNLRHRIREIAWNHAGVHRNESGLKEGLTKLFQLESRIEDATTGDVRDKKLKFDLLSAVLVLKAVLIASLSRKESRGAFVREDFPETDDVNWQKNSCLIYDPDSRHLELSHHPVGETVA